jgi:uncharacterized protein DUF5701
MSAVAIAPEGEFQRQLSNLVSLGYAELAGLGRAAFVRRLAPLEAAVAGVAPSGEEGRIPFVLVVRGVSAERAVAVVRVGARRGFTTMDPGDLARFAPIDGVELPVAQAYAAVDVDTGRATLNVTPDDALEPIALAGRSPLTLDEGIAVLTQFPDVLRTHNCFSLIGSRCGDRRVTALWVSKGAPRLGWCWAGNPHTWLGSASCAGRVAPSL